MGNGKKENKPIKGLCITCNKDCYYIPGRKWFGQIDVILCNECLSFALKNKKIKV